MPRPPENDKAMDAGDAAHDGYGDAEQGGPATEGPSVYHPLADAAPSYEEYADPAAAHGWQDAYDRTEELPRTPGGDAANGGARAARGYRGKRRKERPRPSRRALVSAGAVGVASAALVAGFSLSGSSSDGDSRGGDERTGPTAVDPAQSAEETGGGTTASGAPLDGDAPRTRTPDVTPAPSASATATGGGAPSAPAASTAPAAPTATATASETRGGRDDHPGRGLGITKGPR
ncbi:hypothetical protein [Streptomyces sp. RK62]|uniref:hypothetical protein n=1 Tax=Streptomyces sp. RK62 TaxID=2824893 RepID=UPI001B368900|nr:hypothetical protein [Streptomyces sp. RK62]MBQ1001636.1 hypothetical protein [Streptomyces sp. RK62]